jgi:aspartyl-tRNA(Asn)/glutamyl-tRNA(Gln) amidotransferase subunit A
MSGRAAAPNRALHHPAMTIDIERPSIASLAPLVRSGAQRPTDLVRACLRRAEDGREINAFIALMADTALAEARRAEEEIRAGRYRGPLHGIPIAVKDLIDVAGTRTTAGSAVPSNEAAADAPVVARLREAGAIIIGKTNLHEFAFGTTSEETAFGAVRNPLDLSRSAGGSSGGSAAALTAGMCYGAIGTDTGGSIRIPSAACGTVGLKPSYGDIPCDGVVPLSTTLDHVGPMALTVADATLLFHAMTAAPVDTVQPAKGRQRLGVPGPYLCDLLEPGVRDALQRVRRALTEAGHDVVDVRIELADLTPHVYVHLSLPEAAWYHAPLLERHASSYSRGVRLRIEMGRYVLAEDYLRALRLRDALTERVDRALDGCDGLLLPTLPIPAPPLGVQSIVIDGRKEPLRAAMLRLTQLFNITGHPAIALPTPRERDGLPRSVQLVGHRSATIPLLETAAALEPYISGGPGSVGGGTG